MLKKLVRDRVLPIINYDYDGSIARLTTEDNAFQSQMLRVSYPSINFKAMVDSDWMRICRISPPPGPSRAIARLG
jgi:hypothetical protein